MGSCNTCGKSLTVVGLFEVYQHKAGDPCPHCGWEEVTRNIAQKSRYMPGYGLTPAEAAIEREVSARRKRDESRILNAAIQKAEADVALQQMAPEYAPRVTCKPGWVQVFRGLPGRGSWVWERNTPGMVEEIDAIYNQYLKERGAIDIP